jgi:hypothetical protein
MRRLITICLLALSAVSLLGLAPAASAAKKKGPVPKITKVSPMRVSVGRLLTIRGKNFKAKRSRNTVIFRSSSGRTAFAKPRRASRTRLVVRVPEAVSRLLTLRNGQQRPTRLKLRVLAGRFSKYTTRRLSPVVTGVGKGGGKGGVAAACNDDSDHDNDLLGNADELAIGTDPCLEDTDGDQMIDGWEYFAAKDLNIKAVPYPGKRPYPNALDPADGGTKGATGSAYDFDGDGLTTLEEFRVWRFTGSSFNASKAGGLDLESPLGYSDGTKYSRASESPGVPAWRSASYGLPNPAQAFPSTYQFPRFGDGAWRDSERDADGDGLANWLEAARGPSNNTWWASFWSDDDRFDPTIKPWSEEYYCGQSPGYFDERPFANLDLADSDVDGDTLLDGEDDQDNDGYTNIVELYETEYDLDGNGVGGVNPAWCGQLPGRTPSIDIGGVAWAVNAMNPCAPDPASRTCEDFPPF